MEAKRNLCGVFGVKAVTARTRQRWLVKFLLGDFSLKHEPRLGRTSDVSDEVLCKMIRTNTTLTFTEIGFKLGIHQTTALNYNKRLDFVSKLYIWVPHELNEKYLMDRISICSNPARHAKEPLLDHLVTVDEKWIGGLKKVQAVEKKGYAYKGGDTTNHIKSWRVSEEGYVVLLPRLQGDRKEQERSKREEREREKRMAREARQHELELRKLELSQQNQPLNDEFGRRVEIGPKIQLTQITTKFDEKHDDISLYLINFERKAELAQVPKKDWVAYLLAVLPAELSNMLAREPTERANNYDFVKDLILKRYRLNSEKLKQCFYRHKKSAEKSWRNYAHELNSYFTEWIAELQVKTFEQLKDLLITEQLKYRVPAEVREHFLDDWIKLKTPYELAEKLDEYESIKQSFRRELPKKNSYKFQGGVNYSSARPKETPKDFKSKFQIKKEPVHEKNHEKDFEKRRQLRCYEYESYSHLRPQCDKLKKNYETVASNET
ncbi:histone-lysine N-methyltransferase SETMAR [Trichonephila clavipes]|nr:histone-lysine N-methyltransferase SETMAR [Trichonephila clavipes]